MSYLRIYPYKLGSESSGKLAELLNVLQVKPDGNYVPKYGQKVICWGSSRTPNWQTKAIQKGVTILNKPTAVNIAANKLSTFQVLSRAGVPIPKFTTTFTEARQWLREGATVVERHELRGNSGEGIRIVNLDDSEMASELQSAPLYTKFIPKTAEFRVHVFRGEVIDYIQKKKSLTINRTESFDKYVSSITRGWVFSRTDVRDIPEVRALAIKAVITLGLDFGAVDIVYCDGIAYVLEVNCSPGLAGTTLVRYGNAICKFMGQPDLPLTVTQPMMDTGTTHRVNPVATTSAPIVDNTMHEIVNIRMDRATALKLRSLLAHI